LSQSRGPAGFSAGRVSAIAGIICGAIALALASIVFAALGVILGYTGRRMGEVRLGTFAIAASVVMYALGVLGALEATGALG
jgi:hypothetical protein